MVAIQSGSSHMNLGWNQLGAWIQFSYYMFCPSLRRFDVETVFLYPWAVAFNGLLAFIEALFFAILVVALVYAWRKGALE